VPAVAPDTYSIRWKGKLHVKKSGDYILYVDADSGVRLKVNGVLLIDAWDVAESGEHTAMFHFDANQKYQLRLDYRHETGAGAVHFAWSSDVVTKKIIPKWAFTLQ
jgi:PA14 domain